MDFYTLILQQRKNLRKNIDKIASSKSQNIEFSHEISKKVMDFVRTIQSEANKLNIDLRNIITQ